MAAVKMPSPQIPELPERLVDKLQQANQNLVIASLQAHELQDQAEAAVERQTEFLSMLAHELRNPLAPIAMAAEILEKISSAHPQLPQIQQIISRQVSHMKRLLDDLLDASRVSSGKITLKKIPLLLTDLVRNATEISQPSLHQHAQTLIVELPSQPVMLEGDPVRLAQVLSNLLINASKYSPEQACITLSAHPCAANTLTICVKDHGVGIDPAIQPFIFDLFRQAPGTLDRSEGGLGIGLSMVRTLVEMHGGTVEVRSKGLQFGSEFIVLLPMLNQPGVPDEASAPSQPHPARVCRILVIEDNADANEMLKDCLALDGHSVSSAFDGPSGLAMAQGGGYDLVISDLGLPGMDGFELLRQIRLSGALPAPYCIAMTGYDSPAYRRKAEKVGFDSYLVKPVTRDGLQDVISRIFPVASMN